MFQLFQTTPESRFNWHNGTPRTPACSRIEPVVLSARFIAADAQERGLHAEIPNLIIVETSPFNPPTLWLPYFAIETLNNQAVPIREIHSGDIPTLEHLAIRNVTWVPT